MSDTEEEAGSNPLLNEQFKMDEENDTPTVFILPGDNDVTPSTNGRLDDLNESADARPLFDERISDYEDSERTNDRELLRGTMRDHACSCHSCKSDRSRHDKRRSSDCHSHCNHHDHHERSPYHGDCTSDRCHSHKESPCHSDGCFGSHCNKGNEHGGCHHAFHGSHRGCHDQMCGSMHCHSSRCHGDDCYQKYDWRDYMMEEEEVRLMGKNSAMYKQMYDRRFLGERGTHRNPFDSFPAPFADNMFGPPDPVLMNYNQRKAPRAASSKEKQHHVGGYRYNRKYSESDLAPLDAAALTKNATSFKGSNRGYNASVPATSRQGGRRDILTAPGSAIRRMKELVSKYSDRQGQDGDDVTMVGRQENMELEESEIHGAQGDQIMEKAEAYVCHICGKEFAWAITLKRHMLIHTGVRQYQCTICNKAFTRSHHLKRHMTVHTGEKPYVCHICNKAYSRSDRLSSHMNNHEGYVANKKRGRAPAKAAEGKTVIVRGNVDAFQESASVESEGKTSTSQESNRHQQTELDVDLRANSRDSISGERQWLEPPKLVDGVTAGVEPWNAAEGHGFRIVTSEQMPWLSNAVEQRRDEKSENEITGRDQKEDEGTVDDSDRNTSLNKQSYPKLDDDTIVVNPSMSSSSDTIARSSPYQGFGLSRSEKDALSKFKIHSPSEYRPPDIFGPPSFGLQGPSGPGFIPGSILEAKQSSLPAFSMHGSIFRHDNKGGTRTSPLERDPRSGVPFLPSDPSKFAYSSMLNARSEFINKQRMGHSSMFCHDLPHEMNRPDDTMMSQKLDDRDVKYSSELLGNYHSSRKEEADDSAANVGEQGNNAGSNEESIAGMQSKFKVQLTQQREMKVSADAKPLDPHLNLFTFRHMVHQPGRPRQNAESSGQKRVLPRTFVCRTCNKAFTRSHHLRRHELIHSGQKPFKCTICGRAFNRSDHLNLHLATHYQSANGPRPYSKDQSKGKKKDLDNGGAQTEPYVESEAHVEGGAEKETHRYTDEATPEANYPSREEYPVTVLQGDATMVKTEGGIMMEGFEMGSSSGEARSVSTVDNMNSELTDKFNIISSI